MATAPSRAPEERFSDRVANYVRYRPGYPADVRAVLRDRAGLSPASVVADIGSGTGISSLFLLQSGCTVSGVEPNAAMRGAAEDLLAGHARFQSVAGSAQDTALPDQSVTLITAFQAFHWFPAAATRREFDRILAKDGRVALVWNVRHLATTPFLRAYEDLLLEFGTDYGAVRHENIGDGELAGFFRDGEFERHSYPSAQEFDFVGLKGRLLSSSYAPPAGHPRHESMLATLQRAFDAHQIENRVAFEYDTQVFIGK